MWRSGVSASGRCAHEGLLEKSTVAHNKAGGLFFD